MIRLVTRERAPAPRPLAWGTTGTRRPDGRCSTCGASGFTYGNGYEFSADGVRGYRCMSCGTIKPESRSVKGNKP